MKMPQNSHNAFYAKSGWAMPVDNFTLRCPMAGRPPSGRGQTAGIAGQTETQKKLARQAVKSLITLDKYAI